ncbi:MAG: cytochrome c biogenesis protein CcdA [Hyphomicrobiaceae bacterium]|nr:MAG: cytochrome c biogenesis protein CcdA [Hyphomicrobiaceae bacterium]
MIDLSAIGLASAFVAGAISFVSPCVLPLVPGYVSYVAGRSVSDLGGRADVAGRLAAMGLSVYFVLGFTTVFVLLGASATALGQFLFAYRYELNIVGGTLIILFGLFMLGALKAPWLQRDFRFHGLAEGGRPIAAYGLGLAFAFGWTPCIGPILGAILAAAAAQATVTQGVVLLAVYSLGLGLPFGLAALFVDHLTARIKAIGRMGRHLKLAAGAIMILMGLAMVTGQLTALSYRLLDVFPALGNIG